MKINKTVKGLALGTSLAAFVTLGVPAVSSAKELLGHDHITQVGDKKPEKKKDDKKKDEKKGEKKEGEGSCGEGSCGEGSCGGDHKKDEKKDEKK
jgi:hypothetical protein